MNYKIEEKEDFRVVGIRENVSTINGENLKRIPEIWVEAMKNGICESAKKLADTEKKGLMGICTDFEKDNFNYYIAVVSNKNVPEGMYEVKFKKSLWAVFDCTGVNEIQDTWKNIFSEWFPSSGYEHGDNGEIEYYYEGSDCKSIKCEIWIPVIKK